ncbi:sensor histidine kinase [Paenibacillus woosongensis]|uniref:histidine kinase n=1 Tax=Paenibacillus woosongensis TaxID=307580 RepID=A0A7X2Z0L9_9BACL|nr:sensor histidine kinase [Paenibacillus woosongensis]MUG45429.1 HAMP domain-containing protein [Paenibacillus woosongensis]
MRLGLSLFVSMQVEMMTMRLGKGWRHLRTSIKYKWILLLMAMTLIPLFILGLVSYSISKDAIDKKVAESSKQLIRQTGENIDIRFSGYKDMLMQVITNTEVMSLLDKLQQRDESIVEHLTLTTKLAYFTAVSPEFKSISFITDAQYIKGIFRWEDLEAHQAEFYERTMAERNAYVWFPTRLGQYSDTADNHEELVFSLAKQVFNIHDGRQMGMVVVLDIREEMLSDILSKNTDSELSTESFVIDQNGIILSHADKSMLMTPMDLYFQNDTGAAIKDGVKEGSFVARYKGKEVMVNYQQLKSNDWKVVHIIERSSLYKDSNQVIKVIAMIMILCVLFSIIMAYAMASSVSKPLKAMVKAMKQVHLGNLATRIHINEGRSDEIGSLQYHFNDMVGRIEELVEAVYVEQNNKRIAEVKALEAQINPHFLYNTLDAIKWTALFQKANNTAEMARLLSRLLHISIGKGSDTVLVQEELEHVECYMGIQNLRTTTPIEVNYEIEDEVKLYRTPKVILQPIVENAVLHGFADQPQGAVITIRCRQEGKHLLFEIIDNGLGFEDEVHFGGLAPDDLPKGAFFLGVGLANVAERIKLICGDEYGLAINSKPGKGTVVVITLPILE